MTTVLQQFENNFKNNTLAGPYLIRPSHHFENGTEELMGQWTALLCKKIASFEKASHPDSIMERGHSDLLFVTVQNGKKQYLKEDLTQYLHELNYKPLAFGHRYFIIDHADKITSKEVANLLLVPLEFAQNYCVQILIGRNSSSLLSTIESRCLKLDLGPADLRELEIHNAERPQQEPSPKKSKKIAKELNVSDLQSLLQDQNSSFEAEKLLLNKILAHPNYARRPIDATLSNILKRNKTSLEFRNSSHERIVPLWHLLNSLDIGN